MSELLTYERKGRVATIEMNDGKVNLMSMRMLDALDEALDQAQWDQAVVVLTGRTGFFSAGFDLRVLTGGGSDAYRMVRQGFVLAERMLGFPTPVVIACSGHALAMGAFLVLAGDYRIGAAGPFKIGVNEVAIGLTMPHFGVEICRHRLVPAHFDRAVINAEIYAPESAVAAGFLDEVVPAEELTAQAQLTAARLTSLDMRAHAATKLRARQQSLRAIRSAIESDESPVVARFATASYA
jgi:enoyl-CoA hydratase